jgi:ATP-dependent protease HslVU (ClpYQ) peptidase subunit
MTLIIGIRCKEGVVLGADGAATLTNAQLQPTIQMPVKRKLQVFSGQVVVGVSGDIGLGQRFGQAIAEAWANKAFSGKNGLDAGLILRQTIWTQLHPEVIIAQEAAKAFGPAAINRILTTTAVALVIADRPCLFQFDQQGIPFEASEELPLFAIGSGQMIADPFLAFLRRIFWPAGLPSLAQATLATVWTLQHAIGTHPGGVNHPMQIVALKREGKGWVAKELEQTEWHEHLQDMRDAENVLAKFREFVSAPTPPPPEPPPK